MLIITFEFLIYFINWFFVGKVVIVGAADVRRTNLFCVSNVAHML